MKNGWTEVALGELLTQDKTYVDELEPISYKKLSVKLYGRGVVLDNPANGADVLMKKHQFAKTGQIIVSEIWAKKGALGMVPKSGEGALVTSHFFLFDIRSELLLPGWMKWILKGCYLTDQLAATAFGTTGYAAVRPSRFLSASIPLPPLVEQQRIVAHLDAIEERLNRIQKLRDESEVESAALVISLHQAAAKGRVVKMKTLLELDEDRESITSDGSYPQVGIRSFGNGMFTKPATLGSNTTYKAFNRLSPGKFVMSQVKGWEGAVAVCPSHLDGWFVSPEYRTFSCIEGECDPDYLSHIVITGWFQKQLLSATRGVGARRERVRPEMLLELELPFPGLREQHEAATIFSQLKAAKAVSKKTAPRHEALTPSLLDRIFNA